MKSLSRRQLLLAGAASLVPCSTPATAAEKGILRYDSPRDYQVTHTVTVTNGNVNLSRLEIWVPVPINQPEQTISAAMLSPGATLHEDVSKQALVARLRLTADLPGENEARSLSATYRVQVRAAHADRAALAKYPYRDYTDDAAHRWNTRAEEKVEAGDAEIIRLARELAGTRRAAPHVVRLAYDLVRERTEFKLIDGIGGARYCLVNNHGECSDYSALLVALCRAAGVPARVVTGFWGDQTDGWHCWAEFQLPSGEWIPVDVTLGDQNPSYRERYFAGSDNQRVALCKTCEIKLTGVSTEKTTLDFLQVGAWWWWSEEKIDDRRLPQVKFTLISRPI